MRVSLVVTTIGKPELPALQALAAGSAEHGWTFYVVGDQKSPRDFELPGSTFLSREHQLELPLTLSRLLPDNTYSLKNLGYLQAMQAGASVIVETDDDNIPMETFWNQRVEFLEAEEASGTG